MLQDVAGNELIGAEGTQSAIRTSTCTHLTLDSGATSHIVRQSLAATAVRDSDQNDG